MEQAMRNFCNQNFTTPEKINIYFGHRKRICRTCHPPKIRKNLNVADFNPEHRHYICFCGINDSDSEEEDEDDGIVGQNNAQNNQNNQQADNNANNLNQAQNNQQADNLNQDQNNQEAPHNIINIDQSHNIRIIPQPISQLNILENRHNQESQENQIIERVAQEQNNNLLVNQLHEIPAIEMVPQEQNNNINIENDSEIVASQIINNRAQNLNVDPNSYVTRREFEAFKGEFTSKFSAFQGELTIFKSDVGNNFNSMNSKLNDIYNILHSQKKSTNSNNKSNNNSNN